MNEQDKEEFEKWYFEVPYKVDYHASPDQLEEAWQAACAYIRSRSNPLDVISLYDKLEAERERSQKLVEALEKITEYKGTTLRWKRYAIDSLAEYRGENERN